MTTETTSGRISLDKVMSGFDPCPAPGIHAGVSFEKYKKWAAVNNSLLSKIARTPRHCLEALRAMNDGDEEETTEAKVFGGQFHAALLEPERFWDNVIHAPTNPKTGGSYGLETKAYAEALAATPPEKFLVRIEDQDRIREMVDSVMDCPKAAALIRAPGQVEVAAVWDQPIDDRGTIRCKCRVDKFVAGEFRLEVKTTKNASPAAFGADAYRYGYHRAATFYDAGFRAASGANSEGVILAIEKEPPFAVALYRMSEEAVAVGRGEVREMLHQFVDCVISGRWPAYGGDVMDLELPAWCYARFNDGEFGGGR